MNKQANTHEEGPYRSGTLTPPPKRDRRILWVLLALGALGAMFFIFKPAARGPGVDDVPLAFSSALDAFPAPTSELRVATPLAPLLAADGPEHLAITEPSPGTQRLERGRALRVRFNRPMVPRSAVGQVAEPSPVYVRNVPSGRIAGYRDLSRNAASSLCDDSTTPAAIPTGTPMSIGAPRIRTLHPSHSRRRSPGGIAAQVSCRDTRRIGGEARWVSRSTLTFVADDAAWDRGVQGELFVEDWVRSLDGSSVQDERRRGVVFNNTPHVISRGLHRVGAGAPMPMYFDNRVSVRDLTRDTLVYEIGGGARSIPFRLQQRGQERGRFRVDIVPASPLEAGAQLGVALSPRWWTWAGATPGVMRYQVQPPPQVEGVHCPNHANSRGCRYTTAPGRVVDIERDLRIVASEELSTADVSVSPRLADQRLVVEGRAVTLRGEWATDQVYEVRFRNLRTSEGEQVETMGPLAVRSRGRAPSVRTLHSGSRLSYELGAEPVLLLAGVHIDKGAILRRPLESLEALSEAALHPGRVIRRTHEASAMTPLSVVLPDARPNVEGQGEFRWRREGESSAALLGLRAGRGGTTTSPVLVQQSDLACTVHAFEEEALVWVTQTSNGTSVAGARVLLRREDALFEGRTNEAGIARLEVPRGEGDERLAPLHQSRFAVAASAELGSRQQSVTLYEPGRALGPAHLHAFSGGTERGALRAALTTDRGLYEPGTNVHVVGALREAVGAELRSVPRRELTLRLSHPSRARPLAEKTVRTTRFGTLSAILPLPSSAPLGAYSLQLIETREDDADVAIRDIPLRVDRVRPPTFAVDLEGPREVHGGPSELSLDARYLFGAALSRGEVRWSLMREGAAPTPRAYRDFSFRPADSTSLPTTTQEGMLQTDEEGHATLALGTLEASAPERWTLEAEVRDPSGQATSAHHRFEVAPAALRVGLRRAPTFVEGTERALNLQALVLGEGEEPIAGVQVEGRVRREGWHRWWEWRNGMHARRQQEAVEVHRCSFRSENEPSGCAYTPERPGTYVLEVSALDESGRRSVASQRIYVAGPDEAPDRDPPGAPITLSARHGTLNVGDTAELVLESPWEGGEMLITVSRDRVLHTERRVLEAGSQIVRFEVNESMVPNAFVTASLVRPRSADPRLGRTPTGETTTLDPGAPDLRLGAAELIVRPARARLDVEVLASERAAAGEEIEVRVRTSEDAEVTVFAVDEGLLRLTNHEVGDLSTALFGRDGATFGIEDLRRSLLARRAGEELRRGGDGGGAPASRVLRPENSIEQPVPLWAPAMRTVDGEVRARFRLPTRAAEYRIVAIAFGEGAAIGHDRRSLQAQRNVVLDSMVPAFATVGDTFDARFVVHATGADLNDELIVEVDGAQSVTPIELRRGAQQTVRVPIEVRGPSLRLRARIGDAEWQRTLPVATAGRWTRRVALGAWSPDRSGADASRAEPIALRFPEGAVGQVRITAAGHPFAGLSSLPLRMAESTWQSVDTRSARLLALATQRTLSDDPDELLARAGEAAEHLLELQQEDGAFGRFSRSDYASPWESVFATHALVEAKDAGVELPEGTLALCQEWLRRTLERAPFADHWYADRDTGLAYGLYVLSRMGEDDIVQAEALYHRREQLSIPARAWLSMALLRAGKDQESHVLLRDASRYLLEDVSEDQTLPPSVRYVDRRGALLGPMIAASVAGHTDHVGELTEQLFDVSRDSLYGWRSSVDAAFAMHGLSALASAFPTEGAGEARLDGEGLRAEHRSARSASYVLDVASLAGDEHALELDASSPLFYTVEADYALPLGSHDDQARGNRVALHRRFELPDGSEVRSQAEVPLGTMVRVRLFTYSEEMVNGHVVLHDPLAGGTDAVQRHFTSSASSALRSMLGMGPDDDVMDPRGYHASRSLGAIHHRAIEQNAAVFTLSHLATGLQEFTYVVRATTPGRFVIPPAILESQHDPDFVARSTRFEFRVREQAP